MNKIIDIKFTFIAFWEKIKRRYYYENETISFFTFCMSVYVY